MYVFGGKHATVHACKPEDNLQELVVSFRVMGPRNLTQVSGSAATSFIQCAIYLTGGIFVSETVSLHSPSWPDAHDPTTSVP